MELFEIKIGIFYKYVIVSLSFFFKTGRIFMNRTEVAYDKIKLDDFISLPCKARPNYPQEIPFRKPFKLYHFRKIICT